ncbi:MAG: ABC transporter permease [Coriobacteriia bacterium]|nr:ABC transporter permease [Coriobacteriia bacterium]
MMRLFRADLYRILKEKGLFIVMGVLAFFIVLQIAVTASVTGEIVITAGEIEQVQNAANEEMPADEVFLTPTGAEAPFRVTGYTHILMFILLPLLIFITTADFTSGAAKNTLASGVSRLKYYCSKLIMSCATCTLLLLIYVVASTLAATLISGFGGTLDGAYITEVSKVFFSQLLLCLAVTCVGTFFVFAVRSLAVIGAFIAFMLVPSLLLSVLSVFDEWFITLLSYDLCASMSMMSQVGSMPSEDITKIMLVGAGYLIVAAVAGFAVFRKAEIQ